MIQEFINQPQLSGWPFWVLELGTNASNAEIDKAARDITSKIQFGIEGADTFTTPLGIMKRDEYLIREARSKLQDPPSRLLAEFWFVDPNEKTEEPTKDHVGVTEWYKELGVQLWEE